MAAAEAAGRRGIHAGGEVRLDTGSAAGQVMRFPGRLGLGTWMMGQSRRDRAGEIVAIEHALQAGYRLFDTAEIYGNGGAERVLGDALQAFGPTRREGVFVVSKVAPSHATRRGTLRACEASIERLRCSYLDLYLLHWPGPRPVGETLQAFGELVQRGLIRRYGVSNFDVPLLTEWLEAERSLGLAGGTGCNQIYYSLSARGPELQLLPFQRAHAITTMAYSPLDRGALLASPALGAVAVRHGVSTAQLALAWMLREPDVVTIVKSSHPGRIDENWAAAGLRLEAADLEALDRAFPAPRSPGPLATL